MARAGRKVKLVMIREPNGKPSRAMVDDTPISPSAARRLRDRALRDLQGEEWGTELGRLFLAKRLSPAEYAAGKRWARQIRDYHAAIDAPLPDPKAQAFMGVPRGAEADPDSEDGRKRARRDKHVCAEMRKAHGILIGAGQMAEAMVRAVCERDEMPIGHYQHMALKRGLGFLAENWPLTDAPN